MVDCTDGSVGDLGAIAGGNTWEHSLLPFRLPEVLSTPVIHEDGQPIFEPQVACRPYHRCRRTWRCQTCHDAKMSQQHKKILARMKALLASNPKGSLMEILLRFSVQPSDAPYCLRSHFTNLKDFWKRLQCERYRDSKRKNRRGLEDILYAAVYPHFRNEQGGYWGHYHGVAVVRNDFNYAKLVEFASGQGIEVYPDQPELLQGGYIAYMLEEFMTSQRTMMDNGSSRSGLGLLDNVIRAELGSHSRMLLQLGLGRHKRRRSQAELAELDRYQRLWEASKRYDPFPEVKKIAKNPKRMERLGVLTKICQAAEAAAIELGNPSFALSGHQIAKLLNVSQSTIKEDLAVLENFGIIQTAATNGKQAKEFVIVKEDYRIDESSFVGTQDQRCDHHETHEATRSVEPEFTSSRDSMSRFLPSQSGIQCPLGYQVFSVRIET